MTKKVVLIGLLVLVVLAMTACAAAPNDLEDTPDGEGKVAGFWMGLWHGVIAPITFIISLFNDNVAMYAVHNTGGWYDFGFLLAVTAIWGGSGAASSRRKRD